MRELLKQQGFAPKLLVTDKLRPYVSAFRQLRLSCPTNGGSAGIIGPKTRIAQTRFTAALSCANVAASSVVNAAVILTQVAD
jgi:hypothetical protein